MAIFDIDDIYKKSFNDVEKNIFKITYFLCPKLNIFNFFENKIVLAFMAEIITIFHNNINR